MIPYHEQDGVEKHYGVTHPVKYVILPNKCLHAFKSGKNKGNSCNIKCNGDYCKRHVNANNVNASHVNANNSEKCKIMLKSGKRLGHECNRINCKYHAQKIN